MMFLEGSIVTAIIECVLVGFTQVIWFAMCVGDGLDDLLLFCGLKNCDCGDFELLGVVLYSFREKMTWKDICTFFPILHSYSIHSIILFLTLIAIVEC